MDNRVKVDLKIKELKQKLHELKTAKHKKTRHYSNFYWAITFAGLAALCIVGIVYLYSQNLYTLLAIPFILIGCAVAFLIIKQKAANQPTADEREKLCNYYDKEIRRLEELLNKLKTKSEKKDDDEPPVDSHEENHGGDSNIRGGGGRKKEVCYVRLKIDQDEDKDRILHYLSGNRGVKKGDKIKIRTSGVDRMATVIAVIIIQEEEIPESLKSAQINQVVKEEPEEEVEIKRAWNAPPEELKEEPYEEVIEKKEEKTEEEPDWDFDDYVEDNDYVEKMWVETNQKIKDDEFLK